MLRSLRRISILAFIACVALAATSAGAATLTNGLIDDFSPAGPADLESVRMISFTNNSASGNTGLLMFDGGDEINVSYAGGVFPDLNLDLTASGTFFELVGVTIFNNSASVDVTVTLTTSGGNESEAMLTLVNGSNLISFASFSTTMGAGVNFADVDEMDFQFDSTADFDLSVDTIQVIPEPATAGLLGLGMLGLGVAGRRQTA
jgi:hypothetical protein